MGKKNVFIILILAGILIAVNAFLIWPLFLGEYDPNLGSIGIAHILNARYLSWNQGWNPFWYGGFPNHLIYPLLAPISLSLIQKVFSFLTMPQVYRIVVALAYVLTPVTLFFLVRFMTKRNLTAFFAALIYLLAPSANYFLIPGFKTLGERLHFAPWQLSVITDYGEGPHIMALALVPLTVIAYFRLLRQPTFYKFIVTAFLMGVVVSVNLFSAYALGYFMLGVLLSEIVLGNLRNKIWISLLLLPIVYGLIAYCYDISMLVSLSKSGYMHPENTFHLPPFTNIFLIFLFVAIPAVIAFHEIFKNKPHLRNGVAIGVWFLIFWAIPFAFYNGIWFGSQPNRYMPELNMTVAIIAAFVLVMIYDAVSQRTRKLGFIRGVVLIICFLAILGYISRDFIKYGRAQVTAYPNIKKSTEYKIAKWMEEHIDYGKGERAYLTGSPGFFFNEFAAVPQLRGDEDNGQANPWWADVVYQVNTGVDRELALGWLQAYNVKFAAVDFGASTPFKDFQHPEKFADLTNLADIDGFGMMEIPGEKDIIQAVDLTRVENLKPLADPIKPVLDKKGLLAYLDAIQRPEGVKVEYKYLYRESPDNVEIKVSSAQKSTGILFKSTFDFGWKGDWQKMGGERGSAKITKVGPDLMLIKPGIDGDFILKLSYHRPWVEYLGYVTTIITVAVLIYLIAKKGRF